MKKFIAFLAVAAVVSCLFAPQAQARPQYASALKKAYPDNTKVNAEKNCGVCHGGVNGMNKKAVSDYGKALAEAIGAKNCKDEAKVKAGIATAGEKKEGEKTYDAILKAGDLPAAAK